MPARTIPFALTDMGQWIDAVRQRERARREAEKLAKRVVCKRRLNYAPWTAEREEALRRLWDIPAISARKIAQKLGGTTRAAVIRRAHKLGLPRRRPGKHWSTGIGLTVNANSDSMIRAK